MTMTRFGVVLLLLAGTSAGAAEKVDGEALAAVVAPFVDDRTVGVIHVDVGNLDVDQVAKKISRLAEIDPEPLAEPVDGIQKVIAVLTKHKVKNVFIVLNLADLPTNPPYFVLDIPAQKIGSEHPLVEEINSGNKFGPLKAVLRHGEVVLGLEKTLERLVNQKPAESPELGKALTGAGPGAVRLALIGTPGMRKIFEEVMPQIPEEFGGGSIELFTRGLKWASVVLDFSGDDLNLRVTLQAADREKAEKIKEVAEKAINAIPEFKKFADQLKLVPQGDQVTLAVPGKTLADVLKPAFVARHAAVDRQLGANTLKQIGLALHSYHDVHGAFPPQASYAKGKPLLSWRVHILPYIEQDQLYKQFKLDEPWDSEHNKKLIAQMPALYAPRNKQLAEQGKTIYLVPVGKDLAFEGEKGLSVREFSDGTSNTIMAVEAAEEAAVIWTKPDDLKVDPKKPLQGLAGPDARGFLAALADGSVRLISKTINIETLNALFTRNGGEVVGDF
jgi:hypothetical protein